MSTDNGGVKITVPSDSSLLIPEPLAGHLRDVRWSHVRNPSGDLSAVDEAVEVGELLGVGEGDVGGLVELEEVVEVFVSGSKHFGLVDLSERILTY